MDLGTEGLFAAVLLAGAAALWHMGRRMGLGRTRGWHAITLGLAMLAIMATMDFADEFSDTLWIIAGFDTEPLVEDLLLPLGGVGLLVYGITRWAPLHARLAKAEADAREAEVDKLREVDRFKSTFLNTAAHELATPITPIRLQLAALATTTDNQRAIHLMRRNLDRLQRLVGDLLDSSRLQSGHLKFDLKETDVAAVLHDLLPSHTESARANGIRLRADVATDLAAERADGVRLAQVFDNLLTNAIKFTPSGGAIQVTARRQGPEIVVTVEDTGLGLTRDQLDALFVPFQQHHQDHVAAHMGTGLGLYIAGGIAAAHHGTITADSTGPGEGATFTLRIPTTAPRTEEPEALADRIVAYPRA